MVMPPGLIQGFIKAAPASFPAPGIPRVGLLVLEPAVQGEPRIVVIFPKVALPRVSDEHDGAGADLLGQPHKLKEVFRLLALLEVDAPDDFVAEQMGSPGFKRNVRAVLDDGESELGLHLQKHPGTADRFVSPDTELEAIEVVPELGVMQRKPRGIQLQSRDDVFRRITGTMGIELAVRPDVFPYPWDERWGNDVFKLIAAGIVLSELVLLFAAG